MWQQAPRWQLVKMSLCIQDFKTWQSDRADFVLAIIGLPANSQRSFEKTKKTSGQLAQ